MIRFRENNASPVRAEICAKLTIAALKVSKRVDKGLPAAQRMIGISARSTNAITPRFF